MTPQLKEELLGRKDEEVSERQGDEVVLEKPLKEVQNELKKLEVLEEEAEDEIFGPSPLKVNNAFRGKSRFGGRPAESIMGFKGNMETMASISDFPPELIKGLVDRKGDKEVLKGVTEELVNEDAAEESKEAIEESTEEVQKEASEDVEGDNKMDVKICICESNQMIKNSKVRN